MSIRAVVLGLFGACVICSFGYFNDAVLGQTSFVGNNMPIAVYGGLILFILGFNPLLRRLSPRWVFSGSELAVILTLTLAACCIPGSGLMRYFTATLVLPHHYNRTNIGWESHQVIDMVPKGMLADVRPENQSEVLNGFIQGLGKGSQHISFSDVPWYAWSGTFLHWIPLILAAYVTLIGLSLVVHQQWSTYEHLPYPIATFANSLLPNQSQSRGLVFGNRLFWIGLVVVFAIHLNNFGAVSFSKMFIPVVTKFDFSPLLELFPTFAKGNTQFLARPTIYFTVIAIAYFLATDVSLSLGVGPFLYAYVTGLFATYGVSIVKGGYYEPRIETFLAFGAYFGMFLALALMGRHYYLRVFRRALLFATRDQVETASVWGARTFLVGMVVFASMLAWIGVSWPVALLYTALMVIMFLVMSRILAETGAFFIQCWWLPHTILVGFLGVKALGPTMLLVLMLVSTVLAADTREALMPFMVNSLKLLDLRKVRIGRGAVLCMVALVIGLAVAVPVTLYIQYDRGMNKADTWATDVMAKISFQETVRVKQRLAAQDSLETAESLSGWSRLVHLAPNVPCLTGFAAGIALVGVFTFCRLRFSKWPFHPVLFLVWMTYPAKIMAVSFLIGWLIKICILKYGGAGGYQKFKPLMLGLVAGDMIGGIIPVIIGLVYYCFTGEPPKRFTVLPG